MQPPRHQDLASAAGRVLMVGLPGPTLDPTARARLEDLGPGGAILFARNLTTPAAAIDLLGELQGVLPRAPLFALDQEGGRVSRLEPWIGPTPSAAAIAARGERAAEQFGCATAALLRALGFNVDYAPVVDLCAAQARNGIGERSFGVDPERVAALALAFLVGLESEGVAGCLKHFPGLGATTVDSHVELPTDRRSARTLERRDLVPFHRLAGRAAAVMVSHGHYPALDPTPGLPASLSREIVRGWLRARVGYRGLVVGDDLEMGAVAPLDKDGSAAVRAIDAGCDLVLYCSDLARAAGAKRRLVERAVRDEAFRERLRDAARAVERAALRWPVPAGELVAFEAARDELWSRLRSASDR